MNWSEKDLKNLQHNLEKRKKPAVKIPKIEKISIEKEHIKKVLWVLVQDKLIDEYVSELNFHESRNFRFDWAIPSMKIAIEYEGIFSNKSGHTTVTGYTKDCDKYNLAVLDGWKLLRYTAKNYKQCYDDLKKLIKK